MMAAQQLPLPLPATAAPAPIAASGPGAFDPAALAGRIGERPVFAFYSKVREHKDAFIDLLKARHPGCLFIYLCPRVVVEHVKARHPGFKVVAIEHFTRRDVFLRLHDLAGPRTVIVMENVARYTHLSSDKFNYLHRLRMATEHRYLVDIVPFHRAIHKLYLPLSYLDREILQYSNGWAFEYNYLEEDEHGRVRRAHDLDFLAGKVSPWAYVDYPAFLPPIEYVDSALTPDEHAVYAARKAQLFEEYDNPLKIVTEICDCANMLASRYDSLVETLRDAGGHAVVYTNIVKNNALIRQHLRRRRARLDVEYRTYMTHQNRPVEADVVALFETPINQNQLAALDVLADVRPGARVLLFRNDARADGYIFGQVQPEWSAIDAFTRELWRVQSGASASAAPSGAPDSRQEAAT